MGYKRKNNKRARSIAARKVEKAAAVAAAEKIATVGDDDDHSSAVELCNTGLSSAPSAGDKDVPRASAAISATCRSSTAAAASVNEAKLEDADAEAACQAEQSETQQQSGASGDRCSLSTSGLLFSAPPTPADLALLNAASGAAGLPSLLAATHLPCIAGSTPCRPQESVDEGGEGNYVAYVLSEQWSDAATVSMTIWGVYSPRSGDCLQVVHWHHLPVANGSPVTSGDHHMSPASCDAQQTRELIMSVNADGLCFMLAPSSLVSVEGGGAAGSMTPASASSESDAAASAAAAASASADVYWVIPSVLKESFLALLHAQEWLRKTPLHHSTPEACPRSLECHGWRVRPHPSRWAHVTPYLAAAVAAEAAEGCKPHAALSPPTVAPVAPKRKMKKAKRQSSPHPPPRAQPQQQSVITAPANVSQQMVDATNNMLAANGAPSSSRLQYRVPYVAAVQQHPKSCSGATESRGPLAADSAIADTPVVLLLGNRIAAYPTGDACSATV
ncbi:hypothetical protein LSCM1_06545 [Leishmania martiniquensis]|uniref:Uncharacterized protein n=1 Tax=Leishmania martiniquensis TaxID=1580590 RepID=A0A836H2Q4_9TRYP|nr:hypothetical protein LSCM1_06545 [Leishmania martiniquensis]